MRHNKAVEVDLGERGKGWHYANVGKSGGGAIGFCGEHKPHDSEPEARQCYRRYERSQIRLDVALSDWSGCRVCHQPTKLAADFDGYHVAPLCKEHLTLEQAIDKLGLAEDEAGDSWQS